MKTTGFPDTDREHLQEAFNAEFEADKEKAKIARREVRRRAARQAGLQRRRMLMEKMLQEEQDELVKDHQLGLIMELIRGNTYGDTARLDLNSISCRSLSKSLWINNTLTCIDLSANKLNDHAGSYLAHVMKRNTSVKKLELDSNEFGSMTLTAFGESLTVNRTLTYLSLDTNPLLGAASATAAGADYSGLVSFAQSLATNKTLLSINLWRTGIGPVGGEILSKCIGRNNSLLFFDLGHNNIDMKDLVCISAQLDRNLESFELLERQRRVDDVVVEKINLKISEAKRAEEDQEDLSKWLQERRQQRAESRRSLQEERYDENRALALEEKRIAMEAKERERKLAEEAEAKKKKKKGGKK